MSFHSNTSSYEFLKTAVADSFRRSFTHVGKLYSALSRSKALITHLCDSWEGRGLTIHHCHRLADLGATKSSMLTSTKHGEHRLGNFISLP